MATKPRAVLDASCLLRAILESAEDAQEWVAAVDEGRIEALIPDLLYAELANGLVTQARRGSIAVEHVLTAIRDVGLLPMQATGSHVMAETASVLALRRGITAYDAHYAALAEAHDAVLVTADRGLAAAVSRSVLLE